MLRGEMGNFQGHGEQKSKTNSAGTSLDGEGDRDHFRLEEETIKHMQNQKYVCVGGLRLNVECGVLWMVPMVIFIFMTPANRRVICASMSSFFFCRWC